MNHIFENAHCHTYMSNPLTLPDSTVSIFDYAKVYAQRGMQCVVASEHGYRGDVWAQADAAKKFSTPDNPMKAICAAEVYFVPNRDPELKDGRNFHLLLIAKDMVGFKQLNLALSKAQMTGFYKAGRLDFELLNELDYRHFLCTTACVGGIFKDEMGAGYACQLAEIFRENFRLEVQYHETPEQAAHNMKVLRMYNRYHWPLFFATDSHYIFHEEAVLRKELQQSRKIFMEDSGWDLYLPTGEEVFQAMIRQGVLSKAQIEEAMENTLQLREFEGFSYTTERKLPISKPRQYMTPDERKLLYQKMVCDGYIQKAGMPPKEEAQALRDEMNTIVNTDSEDYFISLKDMLDRGVELGGVLTTTARGSAGSFASNYALGFTTINRLKAPVTMYPERFISADKLKAGNPDIDSNLTNVEAFEQAGKEMFGEFGCLPLVAYGKTKTSSAFKLLARARNLDFDVANAISKQIQNYELDKKHALENNVDDPDYNVDNDIRIENYVEEQYLPLVEDSKQYQGIVVSIAPHPCAHLTYHKDMREEIGVVRIKDKYCLFIDGVTADKLNYVKSDLLRVDVVKIIADSFKLAGLPVMPVDELLEKIKDDPLVWDLYAKGYTQGLNQCERPASTLKCMQFKPKNIVELCAFVAAIRPGFKSMLPTFISRTKFQYGIPSLDELLKIDGMTGESGNSAFLLFDEQILKLLIAGGIPAAEAYATIKHIKKKHKDQVLEEKEKFKKGFTEYLWEKEKAPEKLAIEVCEKVWRIIEDSSSYLFCAAHAFAYACDSAYCAWLKAHYPYEFYVTMLKLYTEKGNKEKVAAIIEEMKRYRGIHMTPGQWSQDNRDWLVNKEKRTISQALSSIKFISSQAAEDLYQLYQKRAAWIGTEYIKTKDLDEDGNPIILEKPRESSFDSFTMLLRCLQMSTSLDTRQISVLIKIGYFSPFGKSGKLMAVFNEFFEGKNKLTKSIKSFMKRLEYMESFERAQPDIELPVTERLEAENENIGLCVSSFPQAANNLFFVQEIDDTYGVKAKLYSVQRGTQGTMRISRDKYNPFTFSANSCIIVDDCKRTQRCIYRGKQRVPIPNEFDYWIGKYHAPVNNLN